MPESLTIDDRDLRFEMAMRSIAVQLDLTMEEDLLDLPLLVRLECEEEIRYQVARVTHVLRGST